MSLIGSHLKFSLPDILRAKLLAHEHLRNNSCLNHGNTSTEFAKQNLLLQEKYFLGRLLLVKWIDLASK